MMKSIFLIMLFFAGVAGAAPAEKSDRMAYATSLNSMASVVMNWYGSLISNDETVSFIPTEQRWNTYRLQYPQDINHVHITSTDLIRLDDSEQYQFKVNSRFSYTNKEGEQSSELISETFIFQVELLEQAIIKSVTRNHAEQEQVKSTEQELAFNRSYYKAREFSYAWLAYLDGVEDMQTVMNMEQWHDSATYSMKIGNTSFQGSVDSILSQRKQYLAKGGGLLRSLKLIPQANKPDLYLLDLIIEWKGVNQTGKPVIAKIHQEVEISLQKDNTWKVQSIIEQHLLPDIAPWVGLLC